MYSCKYTLLLLTFYQYMLCCSSKDFAQQSDYCPITVPRGIIRSRRQGSETLLSSFNLESTFVAQHCQLAMGQTFRMFNMDQTFYSEHAHARPTIGRGKLREWFYSPVVFRKLVELLAVPHVTLPDNPLEGQQQILSSTSTSTAQVPPYTPLSSAC